MDKHHSIYQEITNIYSGCKDKPWHEWLEYEKIFKTNYTQSVTGLFRIKHTEYKCVFKMSNSVNNIINHEYLVSQDMNTMDKYCYNFCRSVGIIECNIDINNTTENPFHIEDKERKGIVKKLVILYEYIDGRSLSRMIRSKSIKDNVIISIMKQVLLALHLAQREYDFTHYDLHSDNILIMSCDTNTTFLYVLNETNQFLIPSRGYYPVIIDYGYSYTKCLNTKPFWNTLKFSNIGICPNQSNFFHDITRFIMSVNRLVMKYKHTPKIMINKRIISNLFYDIDDLNYKTGLIPYDNHELIYYYMDELDYGDSVLFQSYMVYCIDILQSLIILPFEKKSTSDFDISFKTFIKEWIQIEKQINSNKIKLYILNSITRHAITCRGDYYNSNTRNKAITDFRRNIYTDINEMISFCKLDGINFDKMLCSLYVFSQSLEGLLYDISNKCNEHRRWLTELVEIKNTENFFCVFDVNLSDDYIHNKNSKIVICEEPITTIKLSDEILEDINDITSLTRGTYIYDNFKQQTMSKNFSQMGSSN